MKKVPDTFVFKLATLAAVASLIFLLPAFTVLPFSFFSGVSALLKSFGVFLLVVMTGSGILILRGYSKLAREQGIKFLQVMSYVMMAVFALIFVTLTILIFVKSLALLFVFLFLLFVFSVAHILLGIGVLKLKDKLGNIAGAVGVLFIVGGAFLCSIIFGMFFPWLVIAWLVMEIMIFFRLAKYSKKCKIRLGIVSSVLAVISIVILCLGFSSFISFVRDSIPADDSQPLAVTDVSLGFYDVNGMKTCSLDESGVYSKTNSLCVAVGEISGFEKGDDGLNHITVTRKVWDSNKILVDYETERLKEDWATRLESDTMYNTFFFRKLNDLRPGDYSVQYTIRDEISGKKGRFDKNFTVRDTTGEV